MQGRVLIIAGSDSGGGAGIQADIKTVTALGGYAATAITALTAQNTLGVFGVHEVPPVFIKEQIKLVLIDIGADVIKTGMLYNADVIYAIADILADYAAKILLVVDPVMVAKGGTSLLEQQALTALKEILLPRASLITPNIPEAELLTGIAIHTRKDMQQAADRLLSMGAKAVLVKGGHLTGDVVYDLLSTAEGNHFFEGSRINSQNTHGTGCTLASAISCLLAKNFTLHESVFHARNYVREAIKMAPGFGKGHGPLGVILNYSDRL